MKAYISYSINDKDQFILTLLSSKLRQNSFIVTTGQNFYGTGLDNSTVNQIVECHLFIGIITRLGMEKNRVLEEWKFAKRRKIPNLLLIEDSIKVQETFQGNYVYFNRRKPQPAIDLINKKMIQKQTTKIKKSNDIVPWLLGGAALLAIIGILSDSGDKK